MKILIDTEPCETCDFAPCACGRDIEDCMRYESNKHTGARVTNRESGETFYEGES